ncbi:hypothetical protein NQZ79_g6953 [Umbelopsis isabellina]|nr:hypothetical protein NQZ79_g6953 [Umbelopsis isabellina]
MVQQINFIFFLTAILKASDLSIITAERVRTLLEQEYNISLTNQEKSVETLVMDCFYDLQLQQTSTTMPEYSSNRELNLIPSTTIETQGEVDISEEGKLMVSMQMPDYDSFPTMGSFSMDNTFSMATTPHYIRYSDPSNSQSHFAEMHNTSYSFAPQNQGNHPGSNQSNHSEALNLGSARQPHQASHPVATSFPSQVTPSYMPYYQFQSSLDQSNNKGGFAVQPYFAGMPGMPQQSSQSTQTYNQEYRIQQVKNQRDGPLVNGHPYQLHTSNIQQRRFDNGFMRNEQSWPSTVAKLRQMNIKTNIKKKVGKAKKKRRTTPANNDPNAPPKPKRNTGLNRPLVLSATLAAFIGCSELSRPEVVKKLWKYIKENDLQDPADRRYILCDEELKKIFTRDRVNSFAMNRDLSAHLTKKVESSPTAAATPEEAESSYTLCSSSAMTPQTPSVSCEVMENTEGKVGELNAIDIENLVQSMTSITS